MKQIICQYFKFYLSFKKKKIIKISVVDFSISRVSLENISRKSQNM